MWAWLRNTARRGRVVVPWIFFRIRSWSRLRTSSFVLTFIAFSFPGAKHPRRSPSASLHSAGGPGLARLLLQDLAHVADPLLLVGIRLAQVVDLRRHLADLLAVDPGDGDPRLLVHRDLDPLGDLVFDRMRIAEGEHDLAPLDRRLVAHPHDVEVLAEALRHALDGVLGEGPGQPVEGPLLALVVRALAGKLGPGEDELDPRRHGGLELAFGSLHLDRGLADGDLDPRGDGDDLASDARHGC